MFMRPFCQLLLKAVRVDSPLDANRRQELAKTLTGYRAAHGLTQDEFAAKLGVSRKSLHNWEHGRTTPIKSLYRTLGPLLARDAV